jgi:fructokinase
MSVDSHRSGAAHLPRFVAAGEALTDLITQDSGGETWRAAVGGSTWNVARVVAALGVPSAFAGAISTDVFGDALWAASENACLDLRFLQRCPKAPLLAVVHSTQPPRYFFIGDDSADLHFDAAALPAGWMAAAQWVHFGGISLAREPLAGRLLALAEQLHAAGVQISYDPNHRALMDAGYRPTLRRMCALARLIKVSDEDLRGLLPELTLEQALARLRAWAPGATLLYTCGAAGATLFLDGQAWHGRPPAVEVVDTVGAGDASIGALLHGLMQHGRGGQPVAVDGGEQLRWALAGGAAACMEAGAQPPALATVDAFRRRVEVSPLAP